MIPGLIIKWYLGSILILLDNRSHNRSSSIFIEIDPWFLRNLIPFSLLNSVELNLIIFQWFYRQLIFILITFKSFTFQQLIKLTKLFPILYHIRGNINIINWLLNMTIYFLLDIFGIISKFCAFSWRLFIFIFVSLCLIWIICISCSICSRN